MQAVGRGWAGIGRAQDNWRVAGRIQTFTSKKTAQSLLSRRQMESLGAPAAFVRSFISSGCVSPSVSPGSETLIEIPTKLGLNITELVLEFHQRFYCGSNMALVTVSNRSLEEQRMFVTKAFGR